MHLILNIGLKAASTGYYLDAAGVIQAVADAGFFVDTSIIHESDTEPTLVLEAATIPAYHPTAHTSPLADTVTRLCHVLDQDCIAVFDLDTRSGLLIGPKAADWGPFNPAFFLLPDGSRLG